VSTYDPHPLEGVLDTVLMGQEPGLILYALEEVAKELGIDLNELGNDK
jgi:hypothetical protein